MRVTMDRYEADWSIVERGWRAHVEGVSEAPYFPDAVTAILSLRKETDLDDQNLPAFVIQAPGDPSQPIGPMKDGDGVIFFNFRGDRALEISRAFDEEKFDKFEKHSDPEVFYAGMLEYDGDAGIPKRYLIAPPVLEKTLGDYLAANEIRQFAMSETQKFGHITYFWNGNNSGVYVRREGRITRVQKILPEDDVLEIQEEIPSDIVESFADAPEMKAPQIARRAAEAIREQRFDFIRLNFANGDMVGHTGDMAATIVGLEAVDRGLGKILEAVDEVGGTLMVTADHGNAEQMVGWNEMEHHIKETGEGPVVQVSHSLNSVPFIVHGPDTADFRLNLFCENPGLGNVAATILNLLGFKKPGHFLPPIIRVE
jgi:2,3-bisphosphoglycerate-independent phosphoglycerate mutase